MIQKHKPAGAVIISTPQDLALIDATRAVSLFEQADIPMIGLVEHMAGYACPPFRQVSHTLGARGAEAADKNMGLPFLGRIPLDIAERPTSLSRPIRKADGAEKVCQHVSISGGPVLLNKK